ncbi:septal ring lytic transglycosylase RlpA family protein [Pseudoalteromonas sp. BDTF-M6]|uniref:septal ring lytic transglycosylase RlpA family protein n=1 Tax=Pseudoalteromonas sp. BDTF-M6 TaxID=2796132 RepID=UPI001BB04019|nr:septal ring lytic transglycosylase RlpA family protein [Pseudoalteromonas sp. BDTF-M6]MBS3798901.1 septal ring lytic transglycosylase RlpA family protein [Pseudoalteromonas sp. BDTF-M6]
MALRALFIVLISLIVTACSSPKGTPGNGQAGRYQMEHDAAPLRHPTDMELQDAVVTDEAKSAAANRPYQVRGKQYVPIFDETGFTQTGIASWYGRKFHGYHTSNGEVYDMFAMTAAHKTLPLPSFVRVTNVDNGQSVVVRVNDRGPFHADRIIDLSYAAAYKLGYHLKGTAKVKLEAVTLADAKPRTKYIQVAAGSKLANIQALALQLEQDYHVPTHIKQQKDGIFRLRLGPISDEQQAKTLLEQLKSSRFAQAFLLYDDQAL